MGRQTAPPRYPDRLPGVGGPETARPRATYNPTADIDLARRRASLRDLIDIAALIAVDIVFLAWPAARIPFLTRDGSLWILLVLHAIIVASWLRSRIYSRWRARRIASTWSNSERLQFQDRRRR